MCKPWSAIGMGDFLYKLTKTGSITKSVLLQGLQMGILLGLTNQFNDMYLKVQSGIVIYHIYIRKKFIIQILYFAVRQQGYKSFYCVGQM